MRFRCVVVRKVFIRGVLCVRKIFIRGVLCVRKVFIREVLCVRKVFIRGVLCVRKVFIRGPKTRQKNVAEFCSMSVNMALNVHKNYKAY